MKTNSINKSCTHNGVNIDFSFYGEMNPDNGAQAFTASQRATVDGVTLSRTDRYDLEGNRLTEAPNWDRIFTPEYYTALDAEAVKFAQAI